MAEIAAAENPDAIAFASESHSYSFAELYAQARALGAALWSRGLRPGDTIAFQLPNWIEAAVINLAASLLGLVCTPIVPIYRDSELRLILNDSRTKAAFFPQMFRNFDFEAMWERIAPELPTLQFRILVRGRSFGHLDFDQLIGPGEHQGLQRSPVSLDARKVIMYTSGTTGTPKGVVHDHRSLTRIMQICCERWGIGRGAIVLMPSPITHTTGYANGLELPFVIGTQTLLMERWDAATAVQMVDSYGVSMMIGATPFLQELVVEAQRANSRLPSLRIFACGGASIPSDLILRANDWFENANVFRVYGSTEAPLVTLGFLKKEDLSLACTTDGEIGDYEVKVVDDTGKPAPLGEEGELCVKGPCLFTGYTDARQTAASLDEQGFFLTGDVGKITASRALVITDRKKDVIIRGGEKLSAREIEDILLLHPDIEDLACVRMPHPRLGETVCVYAVVKAGRSIELSAINAFMTTQQVARQKFPERLELVESLPRTPSGKVRKDELRKRISAQIAAEETP